MNKKLTVSQNEIIDKITSEFQKINASEKTLNKTVIDAIFEKANERVLEYKNFYREITENNNRIDYLVAETNCNFYNKLVKLFANYPQIGFERKGIIIMIGVIKNNKISDNGSFWISINKTLLRNLAIDSLAFRFENNDKNPTMNKYSGISAQIDSIEIKLADFEESEIFKKKLLYLFEKNILE